MTYICEICWEKPSVARCRICKRYVCKDHFLEEKSLCVLCSETLCRVCGKNLAITTCPSCGRLVCHSCIIDRGGVRICYMCKVGGKDVIFRSALRTYTHMRINRYSTPQ